MRLHCSLVWDLMFVEEPPLCNPFDEHNEVLGFKNCAAIAHFMEKIEPIFDSTIYELIDLPVAKTSDFSCFLQFHITWVLLFFTRQFDGASPYYCSRVFRDSLVMAMREVYTEKTIKSTLSPHVVR